MTDFYDAAYDFRWISSYMDVIDYRIFGDGEPYTATVRCAAGDYKKSIYNHGSPLADWQRDVVAEVGLIHRRDSRFPMSDEVVSAFNAWQLAKHESFVPVRGAFYRVGTGWVVNGVER